jgi:hypothetical protein
MPDYRRAYTPGGAIFLTLVTFNRRPIFYVALQPGEAWVGRVPHQWEFSSFRQFVRDGFYGEDWGCQCGGKEAAVEFEGEGLVVGE